MNNRRHKGSGQAQAREASPDAQQNLTNKRQRRQTGQDNDNHNASAGKPPPNNIIENIFEKAANLEQHSNSRYILQTLTEAIRLSAAKEKKTRTSTMKLNTGDDVELRQSIMEEIQSKWIDAEQADQVTYWNDKTNLFIQFVDKDAKDKFTNFVTSNQRLKTAKALSQTTDVDIERKPVRLEISNVKPNIKLESLQQTIQKALSSQGGKILTVKEGRPTFNGNRLIMFSADQQAFRTLFQKYDGSIPYHNQTTSIRTRLYCKINAKPWICRDCSSTEKGHKCDGKTCANCGQKGHQSRECQTGYKFCPNCNRKGHRARDSHCPTMLNEIIKELKRQDIPIEHLEDKELRLQLVRNLQLR